MNKLLTILIIELHGGSGKMSRLVYVVENMISTTHTRNVAAVPISACVGVRTMSVCSEGRLFETGDVRLTKARFWRMTMRLVVFAAGIVGEIAHCLKMNGIV